MKRLLDALAVSVMMGALVLSVAVPSASALVPITAGPEAWGQFESTGLTPQGWSTSATSPNRVVVSSSRAISGSRSLMVDDTSTSAAASATRPRFGVHPRRTYYIAAYAYQTGGNQLMRINWYDANAKLIDRSQRATSGATMVWQRVSIDAVAPEGARYGELQITSSTAGRGTIWWDAVTLLTPFVTNSGAEATPTADERVPGWTLWTSGGAEATRSSAQARLGKWSLELDDATTTGAARATSDLVPVQPSVTHTVRAWVFPVRGTSSLAVTWHDAAKRPLTSETVSGSKPSGRWGLIATKLVAPTSAHYVTVRPQTSVAGTAHSYWDAFSVLPTPGAPIPAFTTTSLGTPVDGEAQTKTSDIVVVGGRPKLATIVSATPAQLQLLDIQTNRVETTIDLPGMSAGQAITAGQDGKIYLGGNSGALYRFTPGASAVENLGPVTANARNIFDLDVAPDGTIYGGSYPKAELWRVDPRTGASASLGSVRSGAEYARSVTVDDKHAYVGVGSTNPEIVRVDVAAPSNKLSIPLPTPVTSGNITELDLRGGFLAVRTPSGTQPDGSSYTSERRLYDISRKSWSVPAAVTGQSPSPVDSKGRFYYLSYKQLWAVDAWTGVKTSQDATTMPVGRDRDIARATFGGTAGEWLTSYDTTAGRLHAIELDTFKEVSYPIAFSSAPMQIKSLDEGVGGTAYVGGFGGPSLSIVDPADGSKTQYPKTSYLSGSAVIGEVEGSVASGHHQYLGTYTDGRIFRHDPTQPWSDGTNPTLLTTLGPSHAQDRPLAWAISSGRTYFGTVPKYGLRGGGLGIIDEASSTPRFIRNIVPDQSVVSVAASGDVVYGGTSRWGGLGAEPAPGGAKVFAYDASSGRKLWEVQPRPDVQSFGSIIVGPEGTIWTADSGTLFELDPKTGKTLRTLVVNPAAQPVQHAYQNSDLASHGGYIYLQALDKVYAVDPATLRVATPVPAGVSTRRIAIVDNYLLHPVGAKLMRTTIR